MKSITFLPLFNEGNFLPEISIDDLLPDPVEQFASWFEQAIKFPCHSPNAMTLASSSPTGQVTARLVLLKAIWNNGFVFFTDYRSPKSKQLIENSQAALVFHWKEMQRQIRVEGQAEKTPAHISDAYFKQRIESHSQTTTEFIQSQSIPFDFSYSKNHKPSNIHKRPVYWGGWIIYPEKIEFWQAGKHRQHQRFLYSKSDKDWLINRLAP